MYLWALVTLQILVVVHLNHQKSICRVTGDSSQSIDIITFSMLLIDEKSFFNISKWPQTHLLMTLSGITDIDGCTFNHQKPEYGVTGVVCWVFQAKQLLYSLSSCYWLMENHFLKLKKTSNSCTYEL